MKAIVASLAALLIATPSMAQNYRPQYHNHYYSRSGQWVGPAILGAIGTAIILDQYGRQRQVVVDPYPPVVISATPPVIVNSVPPAQPVIVSPAPYNVQCTVWREVQDSNGRFYRERTCTEYPQ